MLEMTDGYVWTLRFHFTCEVVIQLGMLCTFVHVVVLVRLRRILSCHA